MEILSPCRSRVSVGPVRGGHFQSLLEDLGRLKIAFVLCIQTKVSLVRT